MEDSEYIEPAYVNDVDEDDDDDDEETSTDGTEDKGWMGIAALGGAALLGAGVVTLWNRSKNRRAEVKAWKESKKAETLETTEPEVAEETKEDDKKEK